MALINCPECHKEISDTAKRCIYCGYKIKNPKSRKKTIKILSCIAGGIIIVLIVGFIIIDIQYKSKLQEAKRYYNNGEYSLAIKKCNEISEFVSTKDCKEIVSESNSKIQKVKKENIAVDKVQAFKSYLDSLQENKTRDGISVKLSDMIYIVKDLKVQISTFENIPAPEGSSISDYINKVKNSSKYQLMKEQISTGFEDTDQNELASAYGEIDTKLGMTNAILIGLVRNDINDEIKEIDSYTIPSKMGY